MRILQVVFLLSVCVCSQALRLPISDILEIEKLSKDVTDRLFKGFKSLDRIVGLSPKALKDVRQSILFKEFKNFILKIEMFKAQLEGIGLQVPSVESGVYSDVQLQLKRKLLQANESIDFVSLKYKNMVTLIKSKKPYDDLTLEQFARSIVSRSSTSLQSVLDRIHTTIAPEEDDDRSVFKILHEIMKVQGNEMFCNMETSWQQFHLNLYNTLALTELQGLLLMEFSYILLKLHNKGTFAEEILTAQERYKDRSTTTLKLTIEALRSVPTEFWKCDPHEQVKNETYIEITSLLQGYILYNPKDIKYKYALNPPHTCAEKKYSNSDNCNDRRNELCGKNRPCDGTLIDCHSIMKGEVKVCLADAGTNRRYNYMDVDHHTVGRFSKNCAWSLITISTYGKYISYDYCMCYCDEQGVNSDRFFSMLSSESDIDDNKVVTGLRFVKKNRVIHLQIQQGKLLPRAKINVTSVDWKPVEGFRLDNPRIINGLDYHTLTWDKRGFDLDDIVAKDDEVVTGVGFRRIGSHLLLQVRLTPFNFTTGTLEMGKSNWTYNARSQDKKKLNMDKTDIPIMAQKRSHLFSKPNMYLEFTHSDLNMDIAQTTVPFIDAQDVKLAQPVALSGAGLMHKGSTKYGGFITLKIMTYNYYNVLYNAYDDNNVIYL